MSDSKGLKNGHLAFVNEYFLCNMNATDAYANTHPKATRESARRLGSQLLTNVDVQEEIQRRLKEKQLSADEVLARLGDMARSNIADFADVRYSSDLKENYDKARVIKKFKRTVTRTAYGSESETLELELYDAQSALEKIGRHHNLFKDTTTNLNIDLSNMTNDQLERIANGEDPLNVLADTSQSRA